MKKSLDDAGSLSTLARYVPEYIDWAQGTIATLFPIDVPNRIIPAFDDDCSGFWAECDVWLAEHIERFLEARPDGLVVLPDLMVEPTSLVASSYIGQLRSIESQLYHVIFSGKYQLDSVWQIIRQASNAWLSICVMSRMPTTMRRSVSRGEITDEELCTIAKATEVVVIEAYDGMGYLIWRRI
jgi:hypothetical protein